jgi:hypothetical protein
MLRSVLILWGEGEGKHIHNIACFLNGIQVALYTRLMWWNPRGHWYGYSWIMLRIVNKDSVNMVSRMWTFMTFAFSTSLFCWQPVLPLPPAHTLAIPLSTSQAFWIAELLNKNNIYSIYWLCKNSKNIQCLEARHWVTFSSNCLKLWWLIILLLYFALIEIKL